MATDNNIKNFSAGDIEKYHKGLLSAKEMHEMEKTALEDPFLADALEGYAIEGVNAKADITELKKRLNDKLEEKTNVIPFNSTRNNYRFLRAAIVIAFIAGAGLLIYQTGFKTNDKEIAQVNPAKKAETKIIDTASPSATSTEGISTDKEKSTSKDVAVNTTTKNPLPANPVQPGSTPEKNETAKENIVTEAIKNEPAPVIAKATEKSDENKNIAKEDVKTRAASGVKQEVDADSFKDIAEKKQAEEAKNNRAAVSRKTDEQNYRNQQSNIFRGRVTDQNNVGVPFANVTNLEDNAGTYTDAKGNFILTYPDSILTVQVRSLGFENNNVQLRNSIANNQVTLQDDRSLSEVVISNKKPNAVARSRDANMKLEEPEPADGWDNYDSYLANNVKLPDEYVTKQQSGGEVQVSFEVDKNGEAVNFKIEKSLCKKCDQEAIRLIKEGPKWKRKAKHGRTTVTITF